MVVAKYKAEYEGLKFFINNSKSRFQRVRNGSRLKTVLGVQSLHINDVNNSDKIASTRN